MAESGGRSSSRSTRSSNHAMNYLRTSITMPVVKSSVVTSEFIQSESASMDWPNRWLNSMTVQVFLVLVVMTDFVLGCVDTDMRAARQQVPIEVIVALRFCLFVYIAEFCLIVGALRRKVLRDASAMMDFIVCITGVIELIPATGDVVGSMGNMKLLRVLRVVRMLKLLRKVAHVKELKRLLQMATNCVRALAWSMAFCFMVLTIWSLVAVEVLHPLVGQLADEGQFPDCQYCSSAFSSVMISNLTLFQTIMTSDEFGVIAIPVIRKYPATAIIFIGSFITIAYGVLNLVVALVVDTFAEQRLKNDKLLAEDLDEAAEEDVNFLGQIFNNIDDNGDDQLTLDEMRRGARNNTEFRSRLRVLDLDAADLEQLFYMLDADNSGTVDKEEFINTLSRWKEDSRTAARFVKHNMRQSLEQQERILALQRMQYEYITATADSRDDFSEARRELQAPMLLDSEAQRDRKLVQQISGLGEGYQQKQSQEALEEHERGESVDVMELESLSDTLAAITLSFQELRDRSIRDMRAQLDLSMDSFEAEFNNLLTERLSPVCV
eukprot:TRINITY_DN63860_c0_g1_i1.p1 TRINITY_DN63860_c0_g1~~TRINITY_DN63860_c0_g1_i1.p1  ORF type:complete len:551 (+),score=109.67 TRINITY_DN63860_c0_g1_i1:54-1706(+)